MGVSIVVHNSDALFPTNLTNQTVSGDIVTAIVTGIGDVSNLSEPIAMEFTVSCKWFLYLRIHSCGHSFFHRQNCFYVSIWRYMYKE